MGEIVTKRRPNNSNMLSVICELERNIVDVQIVDGLHVGDVCMVERRWSKNLELGLLWGHLHHVLLAVSHREMKKMTELMDVR